MQPNFFSSHKSKKKEKISLITPVQVVFSNVILSYQKFIFYKFTAPTKKNVDLEKVWKTIFKGTITNFEIYFQSFFS